MKKIVMGIYLSLAACAVQARSLKLDFIDSTFDGFVERVHVVSNDRDAFASYYNQICDKLKSADDTQKHVAEGYLYTLALRHMQDKHPEWYANLQPFITDPRVTLDTEINEVRMFIGGFLIRYGAYEEFLAKKVTKPSESTFTTVWNNVKQYTALAKKKVTGWFASA